MREVDLIMLAINPLKLRTPYFQFSAEKDQTITNASNLHIITRRNHSNCKLDSNIMKHFQFKKQSNNNLDPYINKNTAKPPIGLPYKTDRIVKKSGNITYLVDSNITTPSTSNKKLSPLNSNNANKPPLPKVHSNLFSGRLRKREMNILPKLLHENYITPKSATRKIFRLNYSANSIDKNKRGKLADYKILDEIGRGSFAIVKEAIRKTDNKKVAMKIYDKYKLLDPHSKKMINMEIEILKKLNHSNIVKLYEVIDTVKELYLVMENIKGKTLYSFLKSREKRRLPECEAKKIFREIVLGIKYCHEHNISHRDIKLENILLTENKSVKIIDFGLSTLSSPNTKSFLFCGTPSYMAPEIVTKKEFSGPPADIWALGVLLYVITMGRYPFKANNSVE